MAKKDLNDYITTVQPIKPSAEVQFRSKNEQGEVTESVASRTYIAKHADKEVEAVSRNPSLSDRLNKVTERAVDKARETKLEEEANLDDEDAEFEQLEENATIDFNSAQDELDGHKSPMSTVPNNQPEVQTTAEMGETALLIQLVSVLIDKIDQMQNFNPVIHVPAPVIHVTLPETRKTITKTVERDENQLVKYVRESIEETPIGEPLIETEKKKAKKDNNK